MTSLQLALSFLTRLPLPHREYDKNDFAQAIIYFPLIGLIIGGFLLLTADALLWLSVDKGIISFFLLALLVVITGGLHLDGLADTADGFFSGKEKEKILEIMKDSCTGAFGVTAIVLILIGKFIAIWQILDVGAAWHIPVAFVLSRWCMAVISYNASYPRETGTGKKFIGALTGSGLAASTAMAIVICFLFSQMLSIAFIVLAGVTYLVMSSVSQKKIGGITGDVLGATNEITELIVLFAIGVILGR